MTIALTNKRKALNLLKGAGFDTSEIEKGNAEEYTINQKELKKIAEGDKNNIFEVLNKAGKYLQDSILTRSTGHKKYDFSSIRTSSSLCLAELKSDIKNEIKKQNAGRKGFEDLDEALRKKILNGAAPKIRKIYKKIDEIWGIIVSVPELRERYRGILACDRSEQVRRIKESFDILHRQGLSKKIIFTDDQNALEGDEIFDLTKLLSASLGGTVGGVITILGTAWAATGCGIALGIGTIAGGVGFAAAIAIGAAVIYYKRESLGAIKNKRDYIKVQKSYEQAIKYLNDLEDYLESETEEKIKQESKKIDVNENMIKILEDFLKRQYELWGHYTTAAKREYTLKSDKDKEQNKHISGLTHVADEKTSGIGKVKQGIAWQWCKINIDNNIK